ncbi:2-oxo-4-hydroxy-4-carboxy-5-ureidoimidazoline decarboxylase [Stutzerimonas kirkiae]|uniref:2-oxo-4-hydroxy-4-carboxy-5-ureidoimidazoline decarboxylase n=1 Tax=Stutzerimonas kirkiae TaxID=2211392 RepID=A0A4Q9RDJ4_9GAMM|nr:2-oxo-4-hydroxy-4-carboxy-5-ureidoimidazoline decarboxylase [Stutzerimonas kirkiae]TBU98067.1 2-oxo-4-hydroxy-4-carboxy-5-ureidoimidazoline decarboxylase [Stutzerimonas kirkiae]TBV02912.1 2-oxo-4-hydroxy-4-carboxy-5-ureidoimidazoline decarboxylase [Stutzerimonas kirkiae]TBV11118.1 2-oxo-4-hydroxy-4-carboxy-5-ureidoimidazoline decarboxylase [Stutzerimonas kirkiae]
MTAFHTLKPSTLGREAFIEAFADIYEHSPWVAEALFEQGITAADEQIEHLHARMAQVLLDADPARQLALINAHPDLAGKAAVRGELTAASSAEQAGAGIQDCSAEEFERFQYLNHSYKSRFGFVFIMAVKGSDRQRILAAFEERLHNTPEQEFARAIAEINKIALLRLLAL